MFDKFGEFDTYTEINELAANLKNEGDTESIRTLARENGIDPDIADCFITGEIPELCDAMSAAIGKIDIEAEEYKPKELMMDWVEYLKSQCLESSDMAAAVRKKGKNMRGMIGEILKWSFKHQTDIDKETMKAEGVTAEKCTFGVPGMRTAKQLIRDYYTGGAK